MTGSIGIDGVAHDLHFRRVSRVYCGSFKLLSWFVEPVLDLEVVKYLFLSAKCNLFD